MLLRRGTGLVSFVWVSLGAGWRLSGLERCTSTNSASSSGSTRSGAGIGAGAVGSFRLPFLRLTLGVSDRATMALDRHSRNIS